MWENTSPKRGLIVVALAAGIPLIAALPVYFASSPALASARSTNDPRVISAITVGNRIGQLTTPDQRIQVLWANAAVYWYADRIPATRFLWYRNIERIPGASQHVVDVFTGATPPTVAVLDAVYAQTVVDGIPIWQHR